MKYQLPKMLLFFSIICFISCKKNEEQVVEKNKIAQNYIEYASGLSIQKYQGYSVVNVLNPWPNANKKFTYILQEKEAKIPDSLSRYTAIQVPLQTIVVTSTTNVPFLEMLEVEQKLVGFPNPDFISSEKTRALIDNNRVKNIGQNEKLNIEQLIDLNPNLIVSFGMDNNNPILDLLQKSGLKVMIQGDWMEQTPLGKAEWIKLYGALFGKEIKAKELFDKIVTSYNQSLKLVEMSDANATVLYGNMYQDVWYVAKGESWAAQFIKDAKASYLWANLKGTGSESLSFEKVFEKAKNAQFWIANGTYKTLAELAASNPHYEQFDAFKNKNVYSFDSKLGAKGGNMYYEVGPSRPDLILKDYVKIFHPEVLPSYKFTFAQKLN